MKQICALSRIFFLEALSNKFVLIFNLILPVGIFLANNTQGLPRNLNEALLIEQLSLYWGYIILVTIFNSIILNVVAQKERGIYLEYTLISRSKYQVFIALVLVQLGTIFTELLLFNSIALFIFPTLRYLKLLEITFLGTFLAVPVIGILSLLLLLKTNERTFSVIEIILIFTLFLLDDVKGRSEFISLLNPLNYLRQILILHGSWSDFLLVTFIYLITGWMSLVKFDVRPQYK
ncbi:hypothetical protein [Ligilactobacillus faecis]|uniref:hypothetical protein n=1 Tax=Ligilactobacillus faecis TaxID=762833 RepID=UPI002469B032|nr:hypothetical protein [Ligilactobacillus faecis]WGN90297.1 hypothetical protein QFX10_04335 [Ligilactobacillus faecis]